MGFYFLIILFVISVFKVVYEGEEIVGGLWGILLRVRFENSLYYFCFFFGIEFSFKILNLVRGIRVRYFFVCEEEEMMWGIFSILFVKFVYLIIKSFYFFLIA